MFILKLFGIQKGLVHFFSVWYNSAVCWFTWYNFVQQKLQKAVYAFYNIYYSLWVLETTF